MRLKVLRVITWILFLGLSIRLHTAIWWFSGSLGLEYSGNDSWFEIFHLYYIIHPSFTLGVMLFQPIISLSMLIIFSLFVVLSRLKKKSWNDYLTFMIIVISVYIGFVYYFKITEPYYSYPIFSWLDDFTSPRSYDLYIFYSYFCGNFIFMLIYIPLWKWFNGVMNNPIVE